MMTDDQKKKPPRMEMVIMHGTVIIKEWSGVVKINARKPIVDKAMLLAYD